MDDLCVILHVGVGKRKQQKAEQLHAVLEEAIRRGKETAEQGADAMSVVRECIRALEDSPLTNAGIGESFLGVYPQGCGLCANDDFVFKRNDRLLGSQVNRDCKVECDASIVDGSTQNGASVCAVPNASNAIDIAYLLTTKGGPACMAGEGALRWFRSNGGENSDKDLVTPSQRKVN